MEVTTKYHVTLVESDEGWAVWCDDLPGCCSQGDTKEEALANIKDAIIEYLDARNEMLRDTEGVHAIQHAEVLI